MTEEYKVTPEQAQALNDLEKLIGKSIPLKEDVEYGNFGVKIEGKNVIKLSLYHQGLSVLPESISNLKYLTYLNLAINKLSTLPESIGNLKSLKKLTL